MQEAIETLRTELEERLTLYTDKPQPFNLFFSLNLFDVFR